MAKKNAAPRTAVYLKCPKCGKAARRVYAQVSSPKDKGGTGRSTSVSLANVFCGTPGFKPPSPEHPKGLGTLTVGPGQHGLVAVDPHVLAAVRRQAHAAKDRSRNGKKGPSTARKGRKGSPSAPVASDAPAATGGPAKRARKAHPTAPASPPSPPNEPVAPSDAPAAPDAPAASDGGSGGEGEAPPA